MAFKAWYKNCRTRAILYNRGTEHRKKKKCCLSSFEVRSLFLLLKTASFIIHATSATPLNKKRNAEEAGLDVLAEANRSIVELLSVALTTAPSTLADPKHFKKIVGPNQGICCNQPLEPNAIPLVLMDESFGIFVDRLHKPPTEHSFNFAIKFATTAYMWFKSEGERRFAIQKLLDEELNIKLHPETIFSSNVETDGNLAVNIMPAAIRECKNDAGHARNQAIAYYARFFMDVKEQYDSYYTRFPCILITDIGRRAL